MKHILEAVVSRLEVASPGQRKSIQQAIKSYREQIKLLQKTDTPAAKAKIQRLQSTIADFTKRLARS